MASSIIRFLGIVIRMYDRDHPPPHFHAEYGEHEITVENPLRDVECFRSFSIIGHTLAWPNGADFAPEYLHSLSSTAAST